MIITSSSQSGEELDLKKTKIGKSSAKKNTTISPVLPNLETFLTDNENGKSLRPNKLADYIGQKQMVKQLDLILESSKIRSKFPEHVLFYGGPGLGKTTIASLIANELEANFKILAAPSLQKTGDLISLLLSLEPRTVLFIDEIHRLKAPLEEVLYSAMEDGKVDLLMGKGHGASVARLDLNEFMLVGATTQLGKISKPLKDRFPSVFQLLPYTDSEILELIDRTCNILNLKIEEEAKMFLCMRCRGVPRVSNNLLKRLLDYQVVHGLTHISKIELQEFLNEMGIFEHGLTKSDLLYLKALTAGTIGLKTLSGMLLEEVETLELVTEPYLIYLGFVDKTTEGRQLTNKGMEYIQFHIKT